MKIVIDLTKNKHNYFQGNYYVDNNFLFSFYTICQKDSNWKLAVINNGMLSDNNKYLFYYNMPSFDLGENKHLIKWMLKNYKFFNNFIFEHEYVNCNKFIKDYNIIDYSLAINQYICYLSLFDNKDDDIIVNVYSKRINGSKIKCFNYVTLKFKNKIIDLKLPGLLQYNNSYPINWILNWLRRKKSQEYIKYEVEKCLFDIQ